MQQTKLVVPCVAGGLRWATVRALRALPATYVELTDDYAYGRLLSTLWLQQQPFVVCEQDIVPKPGCYDELVACPQPWCGFPYPLSNEEFIDQALGFSKITPTARLPAFGCAWQMCDGVVGDELRRAGLTFHRHWPPVTHLHCDPSQPGEYCPWPARGSVGTPVAEIAPRPGDTATSNLNR